VFALAFLLGSTSDLTHFCDEVMNGQSQEYSKSQSRNYYSAQFWVASSPFFETTLFFSSSLIRQESQNSNISLINYQVKLFDADGEIVNEVEYSVPPTKLGTMEVHNMMEAMKYESGLKHGWLSVESEHPSKVFCRIHARNTATLMGELLPIGAQQRVCFPLSLGEHRSSFLAVVNYSKENAAVRCKLFVGKRSPEVLFTVPGAGARLINLEAEFPEYKEAGAGAILGYIRVSPRNDTPFGVQLVERIEGSKEEGLFGTLT